MMKQLLLLSYPRSGNTFSRYLLEHATGYPSVGYDESELDQTSVSSQKGATAGYPKGLIVKRHDTKGKIGGLNYSVNMEDFDGVILVLRNPAEAIIRHVTPEKIRRILKKKKITSEDASSFLYLFENIEFFEKCRIPKLLITYEELITDTRSAYDKMLSFSSMIGMRSDNSVSADDFMSNIEQHRNASLNRYGASQSQGKSIRYHMDLLNEDEQIKLKELIVSYCSPSCLNYLTSYDLHSVKKKNSKWFIRLFSRQE